MRIILFFSICFFSFNIYSQIGGTGTYEFLNLPVSSKVSALGGKIISLQDDELSLAYYNPSLLGEDMEKQLALNYSDYFIDINYGYVAYAPTKTRFGNIAGGIHYINYGKFIKADYTGIIEGDFTAAEYAFNFSYARQIDSLFKIGLNIKPILSTLETYTSFGIATDIGVTYFNANSLLSAALVIRNFGTQLKPYTRHNFEPLPLEIQAGITKKLAHAPFRISFTFHHLETFDLTYTIPYDIETNYYLETYQDNEKGYEVISDKILRHVNVGVEFVPTKNFYACVGYNYQRAKELGISTKTSTVGFSWGFGFKIKKFHIACARSKYHLAGSTNSFSITTNFKEFYKKAI